MPRYSDWMKRWESFRFIADALRAYVDRKPFRMVARPDWPLVIEIASQKLVSPAIGHVLTLHPDVPDDVKAYFAAVIGLNQERNAILENTICDVTAALNRAGLTPLLLKGAANLFDGLYPDRTARIMGDIDILVPAEGVSAASEVLTATGYPTVEPMPPVKRWINVASRAHHLPMHANDTSGAGVELHFELFGPGYAHLINAKDALARALPRNRDGLRYLLLCPADRVTHNIVHARMHHEAHRKGLVSLRQMADLALLIDRYGGAIDWREIKGRFASAGTSAVLRDQAGLLQEIFGRDIPVPVPPRAATVAVLRRAIARKPAAFAPVREIAALYWAGFCRHPLSAINLLNPWWWPHRINTWRARFKD